jgi:hypothetical protein
MASRIDGISNSCFDASIFASSKKRAGMDAAACVEARHALMAEPAISSPAGES